MFNLITLPTGVSADATTGRPREIRSHGRRLPISVVESVRDETLAYPLGSGPRTVFVVRAAGRRFRLTHTLDDRRWSVEDLGGSVVPLPVAA